jgi:hypothetical protein
MPTDTGFGDIAPKKPLRFDVNSAAASIDQIAAVTGSKIRITSLTLAASGAGAIVFNSAATAIGRVTFKATDPPMVLPRNADGWFETVVSEKFNIGNASTLTLTGFGTYVLI